MQNIIMKTIKYISNCFQFIGLFFSLKFLIFPKSSPLIFRTDYDINLKKIAEVLNKPKKFFLYSFALSDFKIRQQKTDNNIN